MNRREALAKATIVTADAAAGLLDPEQGRAFVRALKLDTSLSNAIRTEIRTASAGEINKLSTASRIIRKATENSDDGYRVGAAFAVVNYLTQKVRLPWEVTEDVFHENIEGQGLEEVLTSEMTQQFALDLEDLEVNGDSAEVVSPDAPFLSINDGILKQVVTANIAARNVNALGAFDKSTFFDAIYAMPTVALRTGRLAWIVSPRRKVRWWEKMTDRVTAAGDAALVGSGGVLDRPLAIPFIEVPSMPDNVVLLADPRNFVRVISWQVRKRRVTGATDAQMAALDKRFYVFFIKHDIVIEELDHVVRVHNLEAI